MARRVGGLDRSADRTRERLPVGLAEELALRPSVEPQPLRVDLGYPEFRVEDDETFTHRRQHAGVACIARADGGSGAVRLGHVVALAEDPGHPAGLIPDGLVDEVEEALLRIRIGRALETNRNMMGNEALAVSSELKN
jgi:hypothetical protein